MSKDLNIRIKIRLEELGISAFEAAKRMGGVDKNYINDLLVERKKSPTADKLLDIAIALECNAAWLLTGEGDPNRPTPTHYSREIVHKSVLEVCSRDNMVLVDPELLADLIVDICAYLQTNEDDEKFENVVDFSAKRLERS